MSKSVSNPAGHASEVGATQHGWRLRGVSSQWLSWLCAVLMASAWGCSAAKRRGPTTELQVVVRSDLLPGTDIDRVEIALWDPEEREEHYSEAYDLTLRGTQRFPLSTTISQHGGTEFVLVVSGFTPKYWGGLDEPVVVQQKVRAHFESGKTVLVQLYLHSACVQTECAAGLSCDPATAATGVVDACVPMAKKDVLQVVETGVASVPSLDDTVIGYPNAPCLQKSGLCNDGDVCNGIEHCRPSHPDADKRGCHLGAPPPCDVDICADSPACSALKRCREDQECDDGLACNGAERCEPVDYYSDARGCVAGEPVACEQGMTCREPSGLCLDCVQGADRDDDGYASVECGGDDCDDDLASVFPGAKEICDGLDNDCDRNVDAPLADQACAAEEGMEARCVAGSCELHCMDPATLPEPDPMGACITRSCENDPLLACDDGRFCNGLERCEPGADRADARGCVSGEMVVCQAEELCVEREDRGECSACAVDDDGDDDGHRAFACGGDDCDDGDGERFPGQQERCDGLDNDCDEQVDEEADSTCDAPEVGRAFCQGGGCRVRCPPDFEPNESGDDCQVIDRCIGVMACAPGSCVTAGAAYRCDCPDTFESTGGMACGCPVGANLSSDGQRCDTPVFAAKVLLSADEGSVSERALPVLTDGYKDQATLTWATDAPDGSTKVWARRHRLISGFTPARSTTQTFQRVSDLSVVHVGDGNAVVSFLGANEGSRGTNLFQAELSSDGLSSPTPYEPAGIERRADLAALRLASDGQAQVAIAFYARGGDNAWKRYVDYLRAPAGWSGPQQLGQVSDPGTAMSLAIDSLGRGLLAVPGAFYVREDAAFGQQRQSSDVRLPVEMAPGGKAAGGAGVFSLFVFDSGWGSAVPIGPAGFTEARVLENGDALAVWAEGAQVRSRRYRGDGDRWDDAVSVPVETTVGVSRVVLAVHGLDALAAYTDTAGGVWGQRYVNGIWLKAVRVDTTAAGAAPVWMDAALYATGRGLIAYTEGPAGRRSLVGVELK